MQDGDSIKRKDEAKRETIEQAHLIHTQTSTEGTYITVSNSYTIKATHVYGLAKKHKQRNNAELQPNMIYTATLRQFYFNRLAPHTHIYTKPQKNRKSRLP